MTRAAAYCRVYSGENAARLDQESQLRGYAERHGYAIEQVYRDHDGDGSATWPAFERLLLDAQAGRVRTVLVADATRLFPDAMLATRYAGELRRKLGLEILFVNPPTDAPAFISPERLSELFDEYASHEQRLRTTLGKQARAQRGLYNGTLPFGYRKDEAGVPVPHPADAEGLVMAFTDFATGQYSDAQIADRLTAAGYRTTGNWGQRPFTKDTVRVMLQNVFYLGLAKYKGETFPGQHPALIDQTLFDQCQDIRAQRERVRAVDIQRKVYVLGGLVRCAGCGLTLRCCAVTSGKDASRRYYRHTARERGYVCAAPDRMLRADLLEQQWADLLSAVRLPDERRQHVEGMIAHRQPGADLTTLWAAATLEEQRAITQVLLKALFVDVSHGHIVAVELPPDLKGLFDAPCRALGIEVR